MFPLYNVHGDLALKVKDHVHKFCGICAWRMQSCERGLTGHFAKYHNGKKGLWLPFGMNPLDCLYQNWDQYIVKPRTKLKLKDGRQEPNPGRYRCYEPEQKQQQLKRSYDALLKDKIERFDARDLGHRDRKSPKEASPPPPQMKRQRVEQGREAQEIYRERVEDDSKPKERKASRIKEAAQEHEVLDKAKPKLDKHARSYATSAKDEEMLFGVQDAG